MDIQHGITLHKTELDDDVIDKIQNDLVISNPKYVDALSHGRRPVIKVKNKYEPIPKYLYFMKEFSDRIEVPLAYMYELEGIIDVQNILPKPVVIGETEIQLREYQEEAVSETLKHNCGIICSPAASGKTIMGIAMTHILSKKTLWIAHRGGLAVQACKTFETFTDSEAGFIGNGKFNVGKWFTGAIVNSVENNLDTINDYGFEVVFIDEVHRAPTSRMFNALNGLSPIMTYGLSATPFREDGLTDILYKMIGPIRANIPRSRLVDEGYIVTPHIQIVRTGIDNLLSDLMEYHEYINNVIENFDRNLIILQHITKHALLGLKCLVLCDRTNHCDYIYNILSDLGLPVLVIHGKNKKGEKTLHSDVASGKVMVTVTTYQYFSDGFDLPELEVLFFVAPFSSIIRCEQTVGRVQRICENKPDAKVVDFVDSNPISNKQLASRINIYKKLGCMVKFTDKSAL